MPTLAEQLTAALQHYQAGRFAEAERGYRQILAVEPRHADALHLLGLLAGHFAKHDTAIELVRQAIAIEPRRANYHCNLGNFLKAKGRLTDAEASYRHAIALKPQMAEGHNNLAVLLADLGRFDEAIVHYRQALAIKPQYVDALSNLGVALQRTGDLDGSVAMLKQAITWQPSYAQAHSNLGNTLQLQGRRDAAIASFRNALQLNPRMSEAHYNLGNALGDAGLNDEAAAAFERVLETRPTHRASITGLVHQRQHMCDWTDLESLTERAIATALSPDSIGVPAAPFCFLTLAVPTTPEQQFRATTLWTRSHHETAADPPRPPLRPDCLLSSAPTADTSAISAASPHDRPRIRLGYLSSDFKAHAVAFLIVGVFEQHDRSRFELFGYSNGPDDGSAVRQRIAKACDSFLDIRGQAPHAVAQRIRQDGIDILIDLNGCTQGSRLDIVSLRPAPIQIHYLGYPGTTGSRAVDAILVDEMVVPSEQQPFYTERLIHLPDCYQANDGDREIAPGTPTRAECGLPEGGFVFCSFNNSYKITPQMFDMWMRLLRDVPGSVLWLLEGNRWVPDNLRREAAARGVPAERLVFAPRRPLDQHLARHRCADLFLDTFPVTAHTTASDALWAGCPVLTLMGETFITRVAASLLKSLDLPELITTTSDEYLARALSLARNPTLLRSLRTRLAENRLTRSTFDAERKTRDLEQVYERLIREHTPVSERGQSWPR